MGAFDFLKKILGGKKDQGAGFSVTIERRDRELYNPKYKKAKFKQSKAVCVTYTVKGTNPNTGKMKTEKVLGILGESQADIVQRTYLQEPYEINIVPQEPATEPQVEYATAFGITLPAGATKSDASLFLTRAEHGEKIDQEPAPAEMVKIAVFQFGLCFSPYASTNEIFNGILGYLKHRKYKEFCEYWAMRVYCEMTGKNYNFVYEATEKEKELFSRFAEEYAENRSFNESINRYDFNEMPLGGIITKKLKAYKVAEEFIKERG